MAKQQQIARGDRDLAFHLKRAAKAMRGGDVVQAGCDFGAVLLHQPGNARARKALLGFDAAALKQLISRAQSHQGSGRLAEAEQLWASLAAAQPKHAEIGVSLARCQLEMGKAQAALCTLERIQKHHSDHPVVLDTKGRALRDLRRDEEARACHEAALGHGDADAGPLNHLGILAQAQGDRDAAQGYYERALALCPRDPDLHHNLSRVARYTPGHPHLKQMQALAAQMPNAAALHFALFNALDSLDQRDTAFAHLLRANALRKAEIGYDLRADAVRFAFAKAVCTDLPTLPEMAPAQTRPIFVTGLPRSGTTLVERVLAQTEGTIAAGELAVTSHAVAPLLRQLQQENRTALTPADLVQLRQTLLDGFAPYAGGAKVMIDKMPLNFRWVGLICAALPEAHVIDLRRDPISVAWSLFRHSFAGKGNGFAYDMGDIVGYHLLHRDLMDHWSGLWPDRVTRLHYQDIIDDTEATLRDLVMACGLDWTAACMTPHRATSSVLTASAAQVARPIYGGSNAAWQRYGDALEPMRAAIEAAKLT